MGLLTYYLQFMVNLGIITIITIKHHVYAPDCFKNTNGYCAFNNSSWVYRQTFKLIRGSWTCFSGSCSMVID